VIDLCCGIGGDLVALAKRNYVCGIDSNPTRLAMARMNAAALGLDQTAFALADVAPRADAVFIDPARRHGQRRVRRGSEYSPPLKFSAPAPPSRGKRGRLGVSGGSRGGPERCGRAQFHLIRWPVPGGDPLFRSPGLRRTQCCRPSWTPHLGGHCLAARGRGGAGGEIPLRPRPCRGQGPCSKRAGGGIGCLEGEPIHSAYLSGDRELQSPFARTYAVVESLPYNRKRLQQHLLDRSMCAREIKKRNVRLDAAGELRQLQVANGEIPISLVLERLEHGTTALICQRIHNSAD